MPKTMNHAEYQRGLRSKSVEQLQFIANDANEAATANPTGENAGYYADEVHYALAELNRRNKG